MYSYNPSVVVYLFTVILLTTNILIAMAAYKMGCEQGRTDKYDEDMGDI